MELSIENGCVLWGSRVVIPPRFHEQLLNELHLEHQGTTRTKTLPGSYLWCPKLDSVIFKTLFVRFIRHSEGAVIVVVVARDIYLVRYR